MTFKQNKRINNSEQPKIFFWSILMLICLCLFSYGYLVRASIVNIVTRQDMEKNISVLGSKVLSLESEYVRAKNNVTLEMAQNSGFITVSSQKFVTKAKNTLGLSVNLR
jgi:hypothetical protein